MEAAQAAGYGGRGRQLFDYLLWIVSPIVRLREWGIGSRRNLASVALTVIAK